jgi:hypothetical protein
LASGSIWGGAEVRGGGDGDRGLKSVMDPPCKAIPSTEKETETANREGILHFISYNVPKLITLYCTE